MVLVHTLTTFASRTAYSVTFDSNVFDLQSHRASCTSYSPYRHQNFDSLSVIKSDDFFHFNLHEYRINIRQRPFDGYFYIPFVYTIKLCFNRQVILSEKYFQCDAFAKWKEPEP